MLSWSSKGGQFTGLYCQGGPSKVGQLGKKDGPVKGFFISRLDLSKCQCSADTVLETPLVGLLVVQRGSVYCLYWFYYQGGPRGVN